jgi:hypothetical protein
VLPEYLGEIEKVATLTKQAKASGMNVQDALQ